jgi:hypothetical protein
MLCNYMYVHLSLLDREEKSEGHAHLHGAAD